MTKRELYSEKLKDPRWQKKRLEIFERDGWTCQVCGGTEDTLHVHHKTYRKNAEPWECPNHWLATVCEKCHEAEIFRRDIYLKQISRTLRSFFLSNEIGPIATGFLHSVQHLKDKGISPKKVSDFLSGLFSDPELIDKLFEDSNKRR